MKEGREPLVTTWNNAFMLLIEAQKAWEVHRSNWLTHRNEVSSLPTEAQRVLTLHTNGAAFDLMLENMVPYSRVRYGGLEHMLIKVEEEEKPQKSKPKELKGGTKNAG